MEEKERPITIERHISDKPFLILPRETAQDAGLGWRALGILSYMLSLPADWQFFLAELSRRRDGHGNGRAATTAALRELQDAGYLLIERLRVRGRLAGSCWHVADVPIFKKSPQVDFLNEENQTSEKQRLQSTQMTKKTVHKKADSGAASPFQKEEGALGVFIENDADRRGLELLIEKFGDVEVVRAALEAGPAPGKSGAYLSAVRKILEEGEKAAVAAAGDKAARRRREELERAAAERRAADIAAGVAATGPIAKGLERARQKQKAQLCGQPA